MRVPIYAQELNGVTLANPYWRLVEPNSKLIYSVATGLAATTTTWANSHTHVTRDTTYGAYFVDLPTGLTGEWDLLIYDNATPANTDAVLMGKKVNLSANGGLGEPSELLLDQ